MVAFNGQRKTEQQPSSTKAKDEIKGNVKLPDDVK